MNDNLKADHTKHVKVVVTEGPEGYKAYYEPNTVHVGKRNTIISFRLDTPTPDDVIIDNVYITPLGQSQLSKPSISPNGKHVVLTDTNTVKEKFHLKFSFKNKKGATFSAKLSSDCDPEDGEEYPIIDNNPP